MKNKKHELMELSQQFSWGSPDFSLFKSFVMDQCVEFIGEHPSFWSSISWDGPPRQSKRFNDLDAWIITPFSDIQGVDVALVSDSTQRRIDVSLSLSRKTIDITVSVPDSDIDKAKILIEEAKNILNITLTPTRRNVNDFRIERTYKIKNQEDVTWFMDMIKAVEAHFQKEFNFYGEVYLKLSQGLRSEQTFRSLEIWKSAIGQNFTNVYRAYCEISTNIPAIIRLDISIQIERGELTLRLVTPDNGDIEKLSASLIGVLSLLEQDTGLLPTENNYRGTLLEGAERTYFSNQPIDLVWFDQALEVLKSYIQNSLDYGIFRTRQHNAPTSSWQNEITWRNYVTEHWDSLEYLHCFFRVRDLSLTFTCEPPHDWVFLNIETVNHERVEDIHAEIAQRLSLTKIEGHPFKPNSSGYYSVGNWSNQGFAKAVIQAASTFTKYSVVEAVVIEDKDDGQRSHITFSRIEPFIERLGQGKRYIATHLRIKGPKGAGLGIHVRDQCTRLELTSHLSPQEFPKLAILFDNELNLKKIAATKEDADAIKGRQNSLLILIGVPVLTSLLTSTLVTEIRQAAIPKYKIQIVNPRDTLSKPISQPVQVHWKLEEERWFQTKFDDDSLAQIRVFTDAALVKQMKNQHPGVRLPSLKPGAYKVEVISVKSGIRDSVIIKVSGH